MGALLGLLQIILRAAADDFILELDVLLYHLFQGHDLRHLMVDGQHDDAHGILQLGVLVQLVQDDLCVGVLADVHHDAHTLAVGLIVQAGDALDALFLHEVGHVLDETGLVDHIRNFRNDDLGTTILGLFDGSTAPQSNFAAAGGVGGADAASAHDDACSGEVRSLDVLHQAGQVDVGVLDIGHAAVDDLTEVVGRDVGGHTDGDALTAVDQQVGEAAGQDAGLFLRLVEVGSQLMVSLSMSVSISTAMRLMRASV